MALDNIILDILILDIKMGKNGEGAAPPATPVKRTKCFRAKKKVFF